MASWEDAWMEVEEATPEKARPKDENETPTEGAAIPPYPETPMGRCEAILDAFMQKADSGPFLDPVNAKAYPWYYEVIDIPMCFSSIKEKIGAGEYSDPEVSLA